MLPTMRLVRRPVCGGGGGCGVWTDIDREGSKSAASPAWLKPSWGILAVALPCGLGIVFLSVNWSFAKIVHEAEREKSSYDPPILATTSSGTV